MWFTLTVCSHYNNVLLKNVFIYQLVNLIVGKQLFAGLHVEPVVVFMSATISQNNILSKFFKIPYIFQIMYTFIMSSLHGRPNAPPQRSPSKMHFRLTLSNHTKKYAAKIFLIHFRVCFFEFTFFYPSPPLPKNKYFSTNYNNIVVYIVNFKPVSD